MAPGDDLVELIADGDHRLTEPVEFGQVFALGGLDHQGAGHREAHGGRVEPIVNESFRDVVHRQPGLLADGPWVDDALMRHQAATSGVENREVLVEAASDVVRVQQCDLAGLPQAVRTQQRDVGVGNRQHTG